MNRLNEMVEAKKRQVAERKRKAPIAGDWEKLPAPAYRFRQALRVSGLSMIGEIKRRSPSAGPIASGVDPAALAGAYEQGGASALSVLTDGVFFGARPTDLPVVRRASSLPVLQKDIVVDAYQLSEARRLGADAVLLIVAALSASMLSELFDLAATLELDAVVEVHDEGEIERAVEAGAVIIGVNNRDLRTFEVDPATAVRLRPFIPPGCIALAESGICARSDVQRLEGAGFDAVLVGECLMRADDPAEQVAVLLGRASRRPGTH